MRRICRLLPVLLFLAGAAPPDTEGVAFIEHPGAQLDLATRLTGEHGEPTTLGAAMGGVPAVLLLGYFHCPSLCGVVRENAFGALAQTGLVTPADYAVLDISIDPHEGPGDAASAHREDVAQWGVPGAATGWHYLTSPASAAIATAVGFRMRWDDQLKQFLHPTGIVILSPDGRVSSYAMGAGYTPAELRADLQRARLGAVAPVSASPVRLLCFHFDASTGRYTLDVQRALQWGGGLIVVAIAAGLAVLIRRSRRLDAA